MENVSAFLTVEFGLLLLGVYLLPSILELHRGRHRTWVVALNVLAGWTIVGWVFALLVAASASTTSAAGPRARPPMAPSAPLH